MNIEFDLVKNPVQSLLRDLKRLVSAHKYEFDGPQMVFRDDVNLTVGGVFHTQVLRHEAVQRAIEEGDFGWAQTMRKLVRDAGDVVDHRGYFVLSDDLDPNLIPDAGINFILDVIYGNATRYATWYHGPFTSNWTPGVGALSNWAGAGSGPLATELANAAYDETNRQAAVFGDAASGKSLSSSAATRFTLASGQTGVSIYGSTLNSIATPAYNATDQILIAATRFGSTKSGLGATDKLDIEYTISGSST